MVDPEILSQVVRVARLTARMTRGHGADSKHGRIFFCYRREDSGHAGRLYDWLLRTFSRDRLFMDVADIDPGTDFIDRIEEELQSAEVLLVLIGPRWLSMADAGGRRRLDNPRDIVRREVAIGLQRNDLTILPVLLAGARMPSSPELPGGLKSLARRNALEISDTQWEEGANRLVKALRRVLGEVREQAETDEVSAHEVMAKLVLIVRDFLDDPDPERDIGDFLVIGAGPDNEGIPQFAIEVMADENAVWCELASNASTRDEVHVMNQMIRLKELGWSHPPEGGYTKSLLKGMRLTRWWRQIRGETEEENIGEITEAILGTFSQVYKVMPEGLAVGWTSHPRRHPAKSVDTGASVGDTIKQLVQAKPTAWW